MRPEANQRRRGGRSSPDFSGPLASSRSLVAPLQRWRGREETMSDTINPKNQPSVKAGQLQADVIRPGFQPFGTVFPAVSV